MDDRAARLEDLIAKIAELPEDWHGAGSVPPSVLRALVRITAGRSLKHTVETGSGKTTLLFSHLSENHSVFSIDSGNSITNVRTSPLFRAETVTYVVGPTQLTVPRHTFDHPLDLVMLDGAHGYPFPELEYWHFYPRLRTGSILIVDDIHIPTCFNMFEILREEEMFRLIDVENVTAFFERTDAPTHEPFGCGWWLQGYNKKRFPIDIAAALRANPVNPADAPPAPPPPVPVAEAAPAAPAPAPQPATPAPAAPLPPTAWQRARAWIPRPVRKLGKAILYGSQSSPA